jgi:hypothetical protein
MSTKTIAKPQQQPSLRPKPRVSGFVPTSNEDEEKLKSALSRVSSPQHPQQYQPSLNNQSVAATSPQLVTAAAAVTN